jgi:uncharacterized protein (DUF305 family)
VIWNRSGRIVAATLLLALTVAVCSSVAGQTARSPVEQARLDSIRRPYTKADIDFMSGMISHHAQAVEMANWAVSHGASASVQVYCARVAMAQTAEIGLMQAWLRDRNQPVPDADPKGMKMVMNGQQMVMTMPGMLTEEQMRMLDAARGRAWDRLFLTFMIQHHQGAISMVEKLFNTDGAGQDEMVFKFANDVQADQSTEIDRMKLMLDAMAPGN